MKKTGRLNPKLTVRQRLFALSRNICAFSGCQAQLINANGSFVGQICHIEAAEPGGQRFNPNQSDEQRRSFENLMIMCYPHHIETNNEQKYPTETLRSMKAVHETKANGFFGIDENIADKFLDQSLNQDFNLPKNINQLDISQFDNGLFNHAIIVLERIARLPQKTRSLYANALIRSISGDLFLCFSLNSLMIYLNQSYGALKPHFDILERERLVSWTEEYDDWKNLPISGTRGYLCGLDSNDLGIGFLWLIYQRFKNEPNSILEIFENLNFGILEKN